MHDKPVLIQDNGFLLVEMMLDGGLLEKTAVVYETEAQGFRLLWVVSRLRLDPLVQLNVRTSAALGT